VTLGTRNRDFPNRDFPIAEWRTGGIGLRGFGVRRFGVLDVKESCIADPQSAKSRSDVACGTAIAGGIQVEAYRGSGFGDSPCK
jgi:hypothetical protein